MRTLGLCLCLSTLTLLACESDNPTPTPDRSKPVTTAAPTTAPTGTASVPPKPEPTAATTADATAGPIATSEPEVPATLLGKMAIAERVKLRRPLGGGEEVVIEDAVKLKAMRDAIGMDQEPSDACPRCMPTVQIVFEDAAKTRLGSVGLFCDASKASEEAVLRDSLAESCMSLKLADAEKLQELVDEAVPRRGEGAAAKEP